MRYLFLTIMLLATPAHALDEPVAWRDPDSGCGYWLTPQGGIAPRYRRDGQPDCPGTGSVETKRDTPSPGTSDQSPTVTDRALDTFKRELERMLGERSGRQ